MKARTLYNHLDKDFDIANLQDDWRWANFAGFAVDSFGKTSMGLVLDNTEEINKVYTSTFPDKRVLDCILERNEKEVLLFSHHAMVWDPTLEGFPFSNIGPAYLEKMKKNNISFYVLHAPLDKNGEYSTTVNLANTLGITCDEEFCKYFGIKVGIIGSTKLKTVDELKKEVESIFGHHVKLWPYGSSEIRDSRIAVVAGGGGLSEIIEELNALNVNTYITGVARINDPFPPAKDFHVLTEKYKINVITASHHTTEKYACIAMLNYFKKFNLKSEFIESANPLNDLE